MARIETCFIAAPLGAKTDVIRDVLKRHSVNIVSYGGLLPGLQVRQSIVDLIHKPDLFVAVIHTPEILALANTDQLIILMKQKLCDLAVMGALV